MDEGIFKLHNRDAREFSDVLKEFECTKEFINVTITSPPYFDVKTYGYGKQIGYGQKYNEYLGDLENLFKKLFIFTKKTGSLWIIVDTFSRQGKLVNLPFDIYRIMNQCGWKLIEIIIWEKDKSLPWPEKGKLRNTFEYVLFFAKTNDFKFYQKRIRIHDISKLKEWWVKYPERYNPKGSLPTNVWKFSIPTQGSWGRKSPRHLNPLPPKLIERILLLTTNKDNVVFDPFAGSGTVLAVANFLGRRWLGFEMNEKYYNAFEKSVLREIKELLHISKEKEKEIENKKKKFEKSIKNLRLLKFPKCLIKEVYRQEILNIKECPINTMFVLSKKPTQKQLSSMPKNKFLYEELHFVFSNLKLINLEEELIENVILKPPLSKFGIQAKVFFHDKKKFALKSGGSFNDVDLWLYAKGVVNKFERRLNFSEWVLLSDKPEWQHYFRKSVPPIISNVKVNCKIQRTWKSEEEKLDIIKKQYEQLSIID